MIETTRLTEVFVEMADTLVANFDLVEFLNDLTDHAAALSGADSVGLMLTDQRGRLQFMAASDESGRVLELFQLQDDDGPCLDCFRSRKPVFNVDLEHADDVWPRFARERVPRVSSPSTRSR